MIEAADATIVEERRAVPDLQALYQYVDGSGRENLVQGLHNVPAPYQAKATNLSREQSQSINRYDAMSVVRKHRPKPTHGAPGFNPNRIDVTLYGARWCGACRRTKELLDHEGVDYTSLDIDEDEDESARDEVRSILGSVKIPLLEINGTYITGYDRKTIMRVIRGG